MFISVNFFRCVLQMMYYVFQLLLTHASCNMGPIPSIADISKYNFIEITSMCYDDNTTHLDYEAIRHHLKFRYLVEVSKPHDKTGIIGFSSYDVCKDPKKLSAVLTKIHLSKQYHFSNGNRSCDSKDSSNVLIILSFMPPYLTKLAAKMLTPTRILYFASIDHRGSNVIDNNGSSTSPYITKNENMFTIDDMYNSDVNIILNTIRTYRFKHILLVFSDRDVQSLQSFHQEHIWEELIKIPDICVDMMDLTESSNKNISSLMEYIKKRKKIKLIIVWPQLSWSSDFINQSIGIEDRTWIWYQASWQDSKKSASCHFIFNHPLYFYSIFYTYFNYQGIQYMYASILNDRWIKRFNKEKGIDQSKKDIFNHFDVGKTKIGEHIDALLSPLQLYVSVFFELASMEVDLYRRFIKDILKFNIDKYTNILNNDCNVTHDSLKIVKNMNYRGQVLYCKPKKCHPGYQPFKTTFKKISFYKNFGWICKKCPSDKVKLNFSTERCISCPGVTIPDKDQINCLDPYADEFLTFTDYKSIIILSVLIPFLTYNMVLIFIFSLRHRTPIIVASGSTSNLVQLLAHLLISIEILVLFFGKLNDTKCTLQVVTTGLLFTLILSLILTKTQKTLFVFKAKIQITRNDVIFTKVVEVFVSVVLIAVQIIISAISYIQLLPTVETTTNVEKKKRIVTCNNEGFFGPQFVYILILAILCSIQALRARNLPKYFTATAEIGYSMYITVVVIMVRFPILSSEKVDDKNFANALFIIVLNSIPVVIRYTKTFYTLIFHPERNTKEYIRNVLLRNVRRKTEEEIAERNRQNAGQASDENRRSKEE